MRLGKWAHRQGIDYKTAYRWYRAGILPVPAQQLPTGTILVSEQDTREGQAVVYARVSSSDQQADLDRQVARVIRGATEQGFSVSQCITEVGSGFNGKRPKLLRALADPEVSTLIVEHRDRLARFGSEYIEAALQASGRKVVILEPGEVRDDLVQDMVDVLTSFCVRLYGRRSAKYRAQRALEATK